MTHSVSLLVSSKSKYNCCHQNALFLACLFHFELELCRNPWKADPLVTIRSMLALCYHGHLSKEFVLKVFSEKYLRHVDKHIMAEPMVVRTISSFKTCLKDYVTSLKCVASKGFKAGRTVTRQVYGAEPSRVH